MNFEPGNFYHIYNRGNNRGKIFFSRENYVFFRNKMKGALVSHCDILAWCLMPNHFHVMVFTKEKDFKSAHLSSSIGVCLRSYTRAINRQERRTGSLFQQHTKALPLSYGMGENHACACFHYIHENPLRAGLVKAMDEWEFSSFSNYSYKRDDGMTNRQLAEKFGFWNEKDKTAVNYNFNEINSNRAQRYDDC